MLISLFFRPTRVLLGDRDPSVQVYSDGAISDSLKTVLQFGRLPGYALTPDETGLTPDITDPNLFALAALHTVKLFLSPQSGGYAYKTRAVSEKFENQRLQLYDVENEIYKLENGAMFGTVQNYYAWLAGMSGLPIWEVMTDVLIAAPFQTASVTRGGITFGSTN